MNIEVVVDVKPLLGESPLWDVDSNRLYFVDSLGRRIFRCTEQGAEVRAWTVPAAIGSLGLRKGGGAIIALQNGFHAFDFATGEAHFLIDPESDAVENRLNDGKVDPAGRFLCGSMDCGEARPTGNLWLLDTDLSVRKIDGGIICSNGPCWSPDGATLYFADSFSGCISAYDFDVRSGAASNKRPFVRVDASRGGAPDGATVDEQGFLWSATVFDGRVVRYAPDGVVDRILEMPVVKITSLTFGGPNLDALFVTSMAEPPLPKYPGDGPQRGAVFKITGLSVRGRPELKFAG